jgi:dTDP-4-dehydrorhamnose reductase
MKKILLFARNGQLGFELQRTLAPLGEVIAVDYPQVDFSKPLGMRGLVREIKPDIIVNPAAYTAVDKAESERELAMAINRDAPAVLTEEAARLRIPFIHYSTDYVYDGTKGSPYVGTDATHPLNVYGQSKLEGDLAVMATGAPAIILRTSWVYSMRQGGFVTKVLQWAREQEVMRVVDDQISSPTSARMLAETSALLLAKSLGHPIEWLYEKAGVYHCTGGGSCSRFEWAEKIIELDPNKEEQKVQKLERAKSTEFQVPADRPMVSVLNNGKLEQSLGLCHPDWQKGLQLTMGIN